MKTKGISHSDTIKTGNITSSTGVAIGTNASATVTNYQITINAAAPGTQDVTSHQAEFAFFAEQIGRLVVALSQEVEKQVDGLIQALREGRRRHVFEQIERLKTDETRWQVLPNNIKAKILRVEASLVLDANGDITNSKLLADAAKELSPNDDESRIRARIARHEYGPAEALSILGNPDSIEGINLKTIFLLELGLIDDCKEILLDLDEDRFQPNTETFRIRALYYLITRDIHNAQQEIEKALKLEPYWISNRFAYGMIDYFQALSPATFPSQFIYWPLPIDNFYVKTDDDSLVWLENALKAFGDLANLPDLSDSEIQLFRVWHFACLAIDPERKDVAIQECRELLRLDPTDFRLIAWVTTRGYPIDLVPSKRFLKKAAQDHSITLLGVQTLTNIYLAEKNATGALRLLKETIDVFDVANAKDLWHFLRLQAWAIEGNLRAVQNSIERDDFGAGKDQATAIALWLQSRQTKDWLSFTRFLDETYHETGDATLLVESCQLMGVEQNWAYVDERANNLIDQISTSAAISLVVIAIYNLN